MGDNLFIFFKNMKRVACLMHAYFLPVTKYDAVQDDLGLITVRQSLITDCDYALECFTHTNKALFMVVAKHQ